LKSLPCIHWAVIGLSLVALFALAACNTAGELPQGPVTPIVPPAGAVATRSAQLTSAPVVGTTPAAAQSTASAAPLPVRQPSAQGGAQIFAQRCAPCHGAGGQGDGPQSQQIVAQMGGKSPDFTNLAYARAAKPTDWFTTISTGRMAKGMPPFSQSLTDEQRWDMVAFLFSLSTPQEQLDRGKAIYADKCVTCHGDTGKSNTPGLPDLSDAAKMSVQSQADLDAVIANGRGAMPSSADLSQDDRLAVADYVRSLSMAFSKTALPAGQSSIVGTLANGTTGAIAPAHQPLTLYALTQDGSSILFTRTVTSDVGGQFAFNQLDPSPTTMYAIQTQYLRAYYTSEPLTFAHGGVTLTVPITVYETTTDAATVHVEQMHMFFDFASGSTTVGQLFIASNSGDRAYIGTDGTSLHLPLPPGATNVRFQDGELGGRYQSVSGGFADTEAFAPGVGTAQILVSYDLPYDGKKLDMSLPMAYPVKSVNVLVPDPGPKLTSPQLTSAGSRQTQGGNMLNYVGGNLAAGASLALQISGAANTAATGGTPSGSTSTPWVLIASAALLLVAVGIVAFVWLRQQREVVEEDVEEPEAQREELLDAIAELDDDFEAGRVAEADYGRHRAELKAELVELMKADK